MIIDLILNRKNFEEDYPEIKSSEFYAWKHTAEGRQFFENARKNRQYIREPYLPKRFYNTVMEYGGKYADNITAAIDYGEEDDVKNAICAYIINCDYNPEICDYINSVNWLTAE